MQLYGFVPIDTSVSNKLKGKNQVEAELKGELIHDDDYSPFQNQEEYIAYFCQALEAARIQKLESELSGMKKRFRKQSLSARVFLWCNALERFLS